MAKEEDSEEFIFLKASSKSFAVTVFIPKFFAISRI